MVTSTVDVLDFAFHPKAIAVIGASENPYSFGYHYVRHLLDYGYPGRVYPVNPDRETVLGLRAYPSLNSIPGTVDYVICCLPADKVLDSLAECAARGVKVVHLLANALSETGRQEAKKLEARILHEARRYNLRLIGPNCLGVYYPGGGIAFGYDMLKESGTVGAVFQSGGSSHLLVRYGESRGLRFSKVVSYGNAIDVDESDYLYYLARDAETKIIAAYFEGVKDGRKLLGALAEAARAKPVIVIKGGRGIAGAKAAASHTAAIAGSDIIWKTALRKAGVIQARDMKELVDFLVAFYSLPPIRGDRAWVVGMGGGSAVICADVCEEAGLRVPPIPPEIREQLRTKVPELWDWLGNPIDMSIMGGLSMDFGQIIGEILRMVARSPHFDVMIAEISEGNPVSQDVWTSMVSGETEQFLSLSGERLKPLVAVVGGDKVAHSVIQDSRWEILTEARARLVAAHVPTYSTVADAAKAVRQVIDYWQARAET